MKKTRREFLKTLGTTAIGAGAMVTGVGVLHSQAKPIVVGVPFLEQAPTVRMVRGV